MKLCIFLNSFSTYIQVILVTFIKKEPPELEQVLLWLNRLKNDQNIDLLEEALNYTIFLVDVDKLYEVALGMYDLDLAWMIIQKSQKDPKEYLIFISELRELSNPYYQRFRIDDFLRRYSKALKNLWQSGKTI
jgi:elongator complex protein 1